MRGMQPDGVSRRHFLASGGALVAGSTLPDWAEIVQVGPSTDAARTEAAEVALFQQRNIRHFRNSSSEGATLL